MTIHYRQHGSNLIVFGNTYPVRDQIKALGGRFNGTEKNWRLPFSDSNLMAVTGLCSSFGGGELGAASVQLEGASTPIVPEVASSALLEGDDGTLTIRQLMDRASLAVTSAFPTPVWVVGEIQNLSLKRSGTYLDLAEARENSHGSNTVTARAVIWSRSLAEIQTKRGALTEILQDGLKVRCLCHVQLYRDRGQISLVVEDIDPSYTKGALALAREKLLKELRAKGLDQAQKRLELTPFPLLVGLISADGSRAKSDFLDQLRELAFPGQVIFSAAAMQGEGVPKQVVLALQGLTAHGVDLIVITRGGGSAADLRWFDAPEIAYAIAACPIPVVAAIGHHEDIAVAEEIAFLRQKTPTAAADFVASVLQATRVRIDERAAFLADRLGRRIEEFGLATATLVERLAAAGARALAARSERLTAASHGLEHAAAEQISSLMARLMDRRSSLSFHGERALAARALKLAELERMLAVKDPTPWLLKGWTQLFAASGPVKSINQVQQGDQVHARLADGRLRLAVEAKSQLGRSETQSPRPSPSREEENRP